MPLAPTAVPGRRPRSIDRLAQAGVRFADAHAHNVVTLPSHANILTGRLPPDHGVRDNAGFRLAARCRDPRDASATSRVSHRRLRERVSARLAVRARDRVRRLRRPPRRRAAAGVSDPGAAGRPHRRTRERRGSTRPAHSPGSPGCISTSRTSPTTRRERSRRVGRTIRTSAKWRRPMRRSHRCSSRSSRPAARGRHARGHHLGSRRGAGRTRRGEPRPLRV